MSEALSFVNYSSQWLKLVSGETLKFTLLPSARLYWPHQPCGCLTWLNMWCYQLCMKKKMNKKNPQAEQNPQSQDHCDLPKGAKHPGSGSSPLQSRLGSIGLFGCSSSSKRNCLGGNFSAFTSGSHKSCQFKTSRFVSIRLSKWIWILGADDWSFVGLREAEESTLKECECCR